MSAPNPIPPTTPNRRGAGRAHPALLVVGAVLFAAAGSFSAGYLLRPQAIEPKAAKVYPQPRPIGDFRLTGSDGEAFDLERWSGHWNLVFFGFTYCPDVCPNTLTQLKAVDAALRRDGREPPRVTFVSVDPERDTPERLASYVEFFNPEFQSATGPHAELESLTRRLGLIYHVEPHPPGARTYAVDHSTALLLVGPDARLHAVFPAPHEVDSIAADLALLMRG